MCDSGVILLVEIRCLSLLGVKGLSLFTICGSFYFLLIIHYMIFIYSVIENGLNIH